MTEEWRPVIGYEGLYEVSDAGRVRSTRRAGSAGGLRKLHKAKAGGYWIVGLGRAGRQETRHVHALVMEAFVGPRPPGMEVRHVDGDPLNANLSNLAYGTSSENKRDLLRHGRHREAMKTHCPSGHPYDDENTYSPPSRPNARNCRTCARERKALRYGPDSRS